MERLEKVRLQLDGVNVLRSVKRLLGLTYKELSSLLGLPESVLSRYYTGDMLPSVETASEIVERLFAEYPLDKILSKTLRVYETYVDLTATYNPDLWTLYSIYITKKFGGLKIDKVLTAAVDGIPLAVAVAQRFEAPLVVAKQYKEPGAKSLEVSYIKGNRVVSLYVPQGLLAKGDSVLIIDDVVRTGKTIRALADLAEAAGSRVAAAAALLAFRGFSEKFEFPVDIVLTI
ncbi:adenine phosphoribosyltransferase [Thermoproteus uzoniensis 768-20]|uniref:Adenine phosphoribosyltransferase n=1 Tax=Thermoproteus uzoniensis (strain 768-20) TaxID=999630 RepID=F2L3L2_THEU7|nr:phosphoribosyltransferase family protein [Thermoproteus uzoniensis]AEA13251.1 adenine phosphoribosyltransferase [Thermoproteus uzoniensis 768-20]